MAASDPQLWRALGAADNLVHYYFPRRLAKEKVHLCGVSSFSTRLLPRTWFQLLMIIATRKLSRDFEERVEPFQVFE